MSHNSRTEEVAAITAEGREKIKHDLGFIIDECVGMREKLLAANLDAAAKAYDDLCRQFHTLIVNVEAMG